MTDSSSIPTPMLFPFRMRRAQALEEHKEVPGGSEPGATAKVSFDEDAFSTGRTGSSAGFATSDAEAPSVRDLARARRLRPTNIRAVAPSGTTRSSVLGDLIGRGEGDYTSFNRGRAGDASGQSLDFSRMSLAEVVRRQSLPRSDPNRLFAVGRFQVIPNTMREAIAALNLDLRQNLTPDLQERIFADFLIDQKRPDIRAYITGDSQDLRAAQIALALEFASVARPDTGRSHYDGIGGNSASIGANEAAAALRSMRQQYQEQRARGRSPREAWDALRGIEPSKEVPPSGLARGARGEPVRLLQQRLVEFGAMTQEEVDTGPGIFGPRTEASLQRFQASIGRPSTGILDDDTRLGMVELDRGIMRGPGADPRLTEAVQQALVARGFMTQEEFATGPGVFGPRTESALRSFQSTVGLSPTGILDRASFTALMREAPGETAPVPVEPPEGPPSAVEPPEDPPAAVDPMPPPSIPEAGLTRGTEGDGVRVLQSRLVELGLMTPEAVATGPGIFGPRTEAAVRGLQRATGRPTNGQFDVPTRAALSALFKGEERGPNADSALTRMVQRELLARGFMTTQEVATGPGVFGPRTEGALMAFQGAQGLETRGRLDVATFRALFDAPQASNWPVPGYFQVNRADRPGEGDGEFGSFRSGGRRHQGIDVEAPVGTRVEPFEAGEVLLQGPVRGFGNTVVVQHDGGRQTVYAHLDALNVRVGQRVDRDTSLGTIGRTGNVPRQGDSHIHFEVREGSRRTPLSGTPVDPRGPLLFPA